MKKIIFIPILASLIIGQAWAQAPVQVEGWPYKTRCIDFGIWMVPRLGIDESQMHVFFNAKTGEVDKFDIDGSFSPGWPVLFDTVTFQSTPIILDIDHDGKMEMINYGWGVISGQQQLLLYLFDDNGDIMPGFPIIMGDAVIRAAEIDADNEHEIIGYDFDNDILFCFDRFGNPKPGWPIPFILPNPPNTISYWTAIGDLDLDGKNEFLLASSRYIYAFRYDGTIQNGFPIVLREDTVYGYWNGSGAPILADIDNDGFLEIITSGDNNNPLHPISFIIIYEHNGTIKEGWPKYLDYEIINCPVTPADINGDGSFELGFQKSDSLTFVDLNFINLPGWPVCPMAPDGEGGMATSDPIIVDTDGDGDQEIFFNRGNFYPDSMGQDSLWYYGHGNQFGLDHLGQSLPGFPFRIKGSLFGRPPTFAIEPSSNRLYMAMAPQFFVPLVEADTLFLDLYRFPDSTGAPNQWPMVSHDNLMTRNYNFVDKVTSITNDTPPPLSKNVVLKQNYPNPFNSQTTISYSLPKASLVTIDIYDLLGRKLETLVEGKQDAGSYNIVWDATNRSSGIYFYRIKAEEMSINRKMVLVK